jgi:hypothetical protein
VALVADPDRARQIARHIASDLVHYHEKKVAKAIEDDDLFEVMAPEIDEGREHFRSRVTPEMFTLNLYDRAIIDVLLKSMGHVRSKIW